MKTGMTLEKLESTLLDQHNRAKDFLFSTDLLAFETGNDRPSIIHAPENRRLVLGPLAERQIGQHVGIPAKLWDRWRQDENPEIRGILTEAVSRTFKHAPSRQMLRTLENSGDYQLRAFLSERYRRLDHIDLLQKAIMPTLRDFQERGEPIDIKSCNVSDSKMFLKVVFPRREGEISVGDRVQSGIVVSNSETGQGSLAISSMIYRLVCDNGMIVGDVQRRYHSGKRCGDDGDISIFADDTLRADDDAFWRKTRDLVKHALSDASFNQTLDKLRGAKGDGIKDAEPEQLCEELASTYRLSEGEKKGIFREFIKADDQTRYGMIQAVTRHSQDVEDYDRATELESLGGRILEAKPAEWSRLIKSATNN